MKASGRSTRSARRHEGTEEVESCFTRTSVMGCLIPGWGWPLAIGRPAPGRQEAWGCRACKTLLADEVADEAARKPASKPSPCPRASARSVLTGRRARTGRAAEDVGPYHRSAPARGVRTARRAMYPRRPRRGTSERSHPDADGGRVGARPSRKKNLKMAIDTGGGVRCILIGMKMVRQAKLG